jgi:hypothetical protein
MGKPLPQVPFGEEDLRLTGCEKQLKRDLWAARPKIIST